MIVMTVAGQQFRVGKILMGQTQEDLREAAATLQRGDEEEEEEPSATFFSSSG